FPEVEGNFSAYNIAGVHRHTCEIDQELAGVLGQPVSVTFSPHLIPTSRGILSTVYADPVTAVDTDGLVSLYDKKFASEPFVKIRSNLDPLPSIKDVRGTNQCIIAPRVDSGNGRIVVISCIDNLVKGASGQAVQCSNLMLGMPETLGLDAMPLLP
ncbi:N-acetyl-gamma-glutamyl-phosphate reductase, partial [bacterium]